MFRILRHETFVVRQSYWKPQHTCTLLTNGNSSSYGLGILYLDGQHEIWIFSTPFFVACPVPKLLLCEPVPALGRLLHRRKIDPKNQHRHVVLRNLLLRSIVFGFSLSWTWSIDRLQVGFIVPFVASKYVYCHHFHYHLHCYLFPQPKPEQTIIHIYFFFTWRPLLSPPTL